MKAARAAGFLLLTLSGAVFVFTTESLPAIRSRSKSAIYLTAVLARIENLTVPVQRRARVVVNERTGTIVMGKDVRLGAVSILHGGFSVQISTEYSVSQPAPQSQGKTEVVPQTEVKTKESPAKRLEIGEGASIDELVGGLQSMGATARDVISILQAIKAAGALDADLEVI